MTAAEVTVGEWMLRPEGDRVAFYFMGEYQFRCEPEQAERLRLAISNWQAMQ